MRAQHPTDAGSKWIFAKPEEKRLHRLSLYLELMLLDGMAIMIAFYLVDLAMPAAGPLSLLRLAVITLAAYICYAVQAETYSSTALLDPRVNAVKALSALAYTLVTVAVFLFVIRHASLVLSRQFAAALLCSAAALVALRFGFVRYADSRLDGAAMNELLIIDDVSIACPDATHSISARDIGFEPDLSNPEMLRRLGALVEGFERVIVGCSAQRRSQWVMLLRGANINGEIIVPERRSVDILALGEFKGHDTHLVSRGPLDTVNRAKKRALDLLITIPALCALAPLLLVIAMAIRLESRGPIFFLQERTGRGNRLFKIFKFRSMKVDASDGTGGRSASRDDERITRVGKIIRSTSLDELPQLFNVLLGDMSLVGPRPHALGSLAGNQLFWEVDQKYWMRHCLKPGITGLAQVRGFRGATAVPDDLRNRLDADLEYIRSWTLGRELIILIRTFGVVIHRNAF